MALGIIKALHERGRRIPEDVSIVGFDDMAESDSFWPPLTTVHQDFDIVGQRSFEILLEQIETGSVRHGFTGVPAHLAVRQSTAR